jgi:predicted ester cyclase
MGIPPTGKPVTVSGTVIAHMSGGKEVEAWEAFDRADLFQQLGVKPPAPQ